MGAPLSRRLPAARAQALKSPLPSLMSLSTAGPHLSVEERAQILNWLDESHARFLAATVDVSDRQWRWKPAADRWSVGETAEHIVLAEALLFAFVTKALAAPANPGWEEQTRGKTEFLIRTMPSGQGKAGAPDPILPRETLTREQVTQRFENERMKITSFAREIQMPLKAHTIVHPFPIFGTLNAHQWLIYVPLHTIRHTKQIADVKSASGYPSR